MTNRTEAPGPMQTNAAMRACGAVDLRDGSWEWDADDFLERLYAQARADLIAELRPVVDIVPACDDPEPFGDGELRADVDLKGLPYGTKVAISPDK